MKEEKKEIKLNLHQKLIEIRKQITYVQKNQKGFNFQYVPGSVILGLLRPKMDELGVIYHYDVVDIITEEVERTSKDKKIQTARTKLKYVFYFTDAENPKDQITCTKWVQGIGDDIQSMGGYDTYTSRYFLLGFFNIPSDKEDPDTFENSKSKSTPKELVSVEQVNIIEELINGYDTIRDRILTRYKKIELIEADQFQLVVSTIKKLIDDENKKTNGDKQ